jgi:hypothetical protein
MDHQQVISGNHFTANKRALTLYYFLDFYSNTIYSSLTAVDNSAP